MTSARGCDGSVPPSALALTPNSTGEKPPPVCSGERGLLPALLTAGERGLRPGLHKILMGGQKMGVKSAKFVESERGV